MRRRLLPALLLLPLAVGCSEVQDTANRAADCAGLAQDVAASGLDRTPTQADAEQAVDRLDRRIEQLDDEDVKQAATTLRDRLRELREAAQAADPAAAQAAAASARDAARAVAETCGIPVDQVLG